MNEIRVEKMSLAALLERSHPRNPKTHLTADIMTSMRRFGFTAPVCLDETSGVLAAGHGRIEALKKMRDFGEKPPDGIEESGTEWLVPCLRGVAFKSAKERDAYLIDGQRHDRHGRACRGLPIRRLRAIA